MIAVNLSKQQVLDPDPRAIQQINFTTNLDNSNLNKESISFLKKQKNLRLFTRNCKRFVNATLLNNLTLIHIK